jgi:hypothetical protein
LEETKGPRQKGQSKYSFQTDIYSGPFVDARL